MKKSIALILFGLQICISPLAAFHYGSDPVRNESEALEEATEE